MNYGPLPRYMVGDIIRLEPNGGLTLDKDNQLGVPYKVTKVFWSESAGEWSYELEGVPGLYWGVKLVPL